MIPTEIVPLAAVVRAGAVYAVQRVRLPGSWSFGHHGHQGFCELIFVEAGVVSHCRGDGGDPLALPAGSLVFIREHDRHGLSAPRLGYWNLVIPTAEWLRLAAYLCEPGLIATLEGAAQPPVLRLPPAARSRLAAGLAELFREQGSAASRRLLVCFLLTWLPVLAAAVPPERDLRPAWLPRLLSDIDTRLERNLRVEQLPRLAGVGAAHLSRTFRRHLGVTPSAWLTSRRIERAALLLIHTDRGLLDLILGLGFASPSWFHRAFRETHGMTPAVYRLRHSAVRALR